MGLVEELKEKGHHGYVFKWGKNQYLFDKTDEVIYNLKTEHQLKWLGRDDCPFKEGYVYLYDGGGDKTRFKMHLRDFKKLEG